MKKEVLLYSSIYRFTAEYFITQVNEAGDEDVTIRVNSPGGDVFATWGMIAKLQEHQGAVIVKVDGIAASMAAFFLAFFEEVECLDVSRIMIHRADAYVETDEERTLLASINKELKAKLTKKIDVAKLKELKGVSIDEIFADDKRVDVWLTAKEAKQIGLVKRIVTLKPQQLQEAQAMWEKIAAVLNTAPEAEQAPAPPTPIKISNKMTIAELKAQHSELIQQIEAAAVTAERDRVNSWMVWAKIDPERVAKGIKDGETLSMTAMSEFQMKALSNKGLADLKEDSAPVVETGEDKNKPEGVKAEVADFEKKSREMLGLK